MAQVNIRIDDEVKANADALFVRLGMNMSTAITIFIHQALQHNGLPFEVKVDPFYDPKNLAHLRKAVADYKDGYNFVEHDLINTP